jgi:hypothetical protein
MLHQYAKANQMKERVCEVKKMASCKRIDKYLEKTRTQEVWRNLFLPNASYIMRKMRTNRRRIQCQKISIVKPKRDKKGVMLVHNSFLRH